MTDQQHPITPPPELVQEWTRQKHGILAENLATQAARWGADQELEACCAWLDRHFFDREEICSLRDCRRPKPSSLKEQALEAFEKCWNDGYLKASQADVIRTALESLPS